MNSIRQFLAGCRAGVALFRHRHRVKFLGPCWCGCSRWSVDLDGHVFYMRESTYDKLRYLAQA